MNTCVVIPTYNEATEIRNLIESIRQQNLQIIVIDDGSSDNTAYIAEKSGAIVLRNKINKGKGASLIRGFQYALGHGFDAIITMDGDGQHLPADIPFFIRLAEYSASGIFIGNRMTKTRNMPLIRLFTNRIMSKFISYITHQEIPDTQCGFRLIKKEVLRKLNLVTSKYETESEILLRSANLGFKIESVPIKTIYRQEKSRINPVLDSLRFLMFIIRELWITVD
ncbi:glycosyltransferase family 2 protein [bacterium]|nr:MAG: glycosyltransferase family 2 protein [bacterium]